jgi:hypothetical protein
MTNIKTAKRKRKHLGLLKGTNGLGFGIVDILVKGTVFGTEFQFLYDTIIYKVLVYFYFSFD